MTYKKRKVSHRPLVPSSSLSNMNNNNHNHNGGNKQTIMNMTKPTTVVHSSRKKARKITTLFHQYTHEKEKIFNRIKEYDMNYYNRIIKNEEQQQQQMKKDNDDSEDDSSSTSSNESITNVGSVDHDDDDHCDRNTSVDDDNDDVVVENDSNDNNNNTNTSTSIVLLELQNQLNDMNNKIQLLGGRKQYQRASQISTSYHSTSKWIIGYLKQMGWLYGRPITNQQQQQIDNEQIIDSKMGTSTKKRKLKQEERRTTQILEIGAINLDLWNASNATTTTTTIASLDDKNIQDHSNRSDDDNDDIVPNGSNFIPTNNNNNNDNNIEYKTQQQQHNDSSKKKYNIHVRAIDIHSMYPNQIEEIDFFTLIQQHKQQQREQEQQSNNNPYDVIVCSMVLNCVPTSIQRGQILYECYHTLLCNDNGGLLFLIIPKTCLLLSSYITIELFESFITNIIGYTIIPHNKTSPKLLYYILQKKSKQKEHDNNDDVNNSIKNDNNNKKMNEQYMKWTQQPPRRVRRGKKYKNPFAISLPVPDTNI